MKNTKMQKYKKIKQRLIERMRNLRAPPKMVQDEELPLF
jgi:hypothetical protein